MCNFFSISELPDYYPDNVNLVYLDDGYHQGLNLLDFDGLGFSVILDKFGNPKLLKHEKIRITGS